MVQEVHIKTMYLPCAAMQDRHHGGAVRHRQEVLDEQVSAQRALE
jgi:hypothetical protein